MTTGDAIWNSVQLIVGAYFARGIILWWLGFYDRPNG